MDGKPSNRWYRLNKALLPIKLHFFLFNAGTGPTIPTMPVYAQTLGYSGFVIGTVYSILPIASLIVKPSLGALADRFKWHKAVLIACEFAVLLGYFCVQFIPRDTRQTGFLCGDDLNNAYTTMLNQSVLCNVTKDLATELCDLQFAPSCQLLSSSLHQLNETCQEFKITTHQKVSDELKYCSESFLMTNSETYSHYQFYVFLVLLISSWGGTAVVSTLSDTICIEMCDDPYDYGKQRLWGSVSYGILSAVSGILVDALSSGPDKNYTSAFYLGSALIIADIILSFFLQVNIPKTSQNIAKDVKKALLHIKPVLFMVFCALVGCSFALTWTFLFILIEELARDSGTVAMVKTIEGLVVAVETCLGEAPAFFFADKLLRNLGHWHCASLILFLMGVRCSLYSILSNPWHVLPVEIIQGYYGLFYSTMTSYANIAGPPGTEATMQSILCAICEGIGVAVGSLIAGTVYDTYGGSVLFRGFGIAFLVAAVIYEIIIYLFRYLPEENEAKVKPPADGDNISESSHSSDRY